MSEEPTFEAFPKIPRLSAGGCVITEKIDGTNGQIHVLEDGRVLAASRSRYVTPEADNFDFAAWVKAHEDELRMLGPGRHYGEWWGVGIQRRYGLSERRFSLFNVDRWRDGRAPRPACCGVVPILYAGPFSGEAIDGVMAKLAAEGSVVAPGFMKPEGIVIFHPASRTLFKRTFGTDGAKGARAA
jgi:hypothetical protein